MRRIAAALLLPVVVACVAVAGCGSSATPAASGNANAAVKVTGAFDKAPTVQIPSQDASAKLAYSTPIKGTGSPLASGNDALAQIAVYKWTGTSHSLLQSTYATGPQVIPANTNLPGLATAMKGAPMGSRVLAVLPPKYAYGADGNSELGVTGSDTLVWVIDLLQQFAPDASASGTQVSSGGGTLPTVTAKPGEAPVIKIPKNAPPAKLSVTTLIKGNGPKIATGDTVVAQYVGTIWRTGDVFSSSWPSASQPTGTPFAFQLGGGVIAGWNDGLPGATVGSRVMLVIPPALGYGPEGGQASAGIKKNDTLVFVIDIIGVQPAAS
jgi:FKBP-type peptidyl-prolyl cis-trans isomerase